MAGLKKFLLYLWNGGLDPQTVDPGVLRERRTISGTVFALLPVALVLMAANAMLFGAGLENLPIAAGAAVLLVSLYLQARYGWSRMTANLLISIFWLAPCALILSLGLNSTNWAFLLLIPVLALLLAGRRHAVFWTSVAAATIWTFVALTHYGVLANGVRADMHPYAVAISGPLIAVMLCVAATVFRGAQSEAERKLRDHVQRLHNEVEIRRAAEEAALAAERSKAVFLNTMSHELRTPLNGVIGAGHLLKNTSLDAEQKELLSVVNQSSEILLELINNVLDLSKLEAGRLALEQMDVELAPLVESAIAPLYLLAREKQLNLSYDIAADVPPTITGDAMRLRQILLNLCGNALKFTAEGSVQINLHRDGDFLLLSVEDSGIGIAEEAQAALFQPFTQAEASTARQFGGTGLGLTIVKHLVELMDGDITVASIPGVGTTFCVRLPLKAASTTSATAGGPAQAPQVKKTLNVLVTDDNEVNRLVAHRMLERLAHNVIEAKNGEEAIEAVQQHPVDLVLMDVQMPKLDGLAATVRIRGLGEPCGNVPIIGLSANVLETDLADMLAAGMNDCIAKPVRVEVLRDVLDRFTA